MDYISWLNPKDLDPEDGFNKVTYSWVTWNIQKIILGYIWVENESILEVPEWMAANNGLHINGRTSTPPSYTEHTTTGTTSVSIPSETEHLWILGLFVGLLVIIILIFLFIRSYYKKGYVYRRLRQALHCNHAQHVWTQ